MNHWTPELLRLSWDTMRRILSFLSSLWNAVRCNGPKGSKETYNWFAALTEERGDGMDEVAEEETE